MSTESYTYIHQLPEVVDEPYPYIGLGDIEDVSQRFDPTVTTEDTENLQNNFFLIQQGIVPDEASFIATSAKELAQQLEIVALSEVNRNDKHVGVIIIDRYIATNVEHDSFFRLNISRDKTGKQVPRPGSEEDVTNQYDKLKKWQVANNFDEVVLMDDALGVGSTLIQTIGEVSKVIPRQKIRAFTGIATTGGEVWSGIEKVYAATGIMTEFLTLQHASPPTESSTGLSICNSRDMTVLGGYIQPGSQNPRRSAPHFLPFTVTVPKNFTDPNKRVMAAEQLLDFNLSFTGFLEGRIQRPLTMQDLAEKGFGYPSSNIPALSKYLPEASASTLVKEHLVQSADIFRRHQSAIFDDKSTYPRRSRLHG